MFYDRDLSWLSFNYRVLMMAADENVPLYERIRFLSIFSSNLDEFFRVRMPALLALRQLDDTSGGVLARVQQTVASQLEAYGKIFTGDILPALELEGIHL